MHDLTKDALVTLNDGETAYLSAVQCGACQEIVFVTWPKSPNFCANCGCSYISGINQIVIQCVALIKLAKETATTPGLKTQQIMIFLYIASMLEQSLNKLNSTL